MTDSAPRFYLVDDDLAVVRMLERVLTEERLGLVVGRAGDGARAEAEILAIRPDIVILDLLMPGQDGIETMASLVARGFTGAFIMLSWVSDKSMIARAYGAGVEFFIQKPLNRVEIVSVVRRVIASRQLQWAVRQVQQVLSPLGGVPRPAAPAPAGRSRAARQVLADLGILGEAGAQDLLALAELGHPGAAALQELYARLEHHYRSREGGKAAGARTIEQRIRRSALAALRHLAALGLEDFSNPQFEKLAGRFFDFAEVRAAMAQIEAGRPLEGRINLKKFVEAFLLEVELQMESQP